MQTKEILIAAFTGALGACTMFILGHALIHLLAGV
jgi:hypothetical protein